MNEVKTGSFNGLNRLPEIAEGEGAVFKNLSLDMYPAAKCVGVENCGEVYIVDGGVDVRVVGEKLQAIGDVIKRDTKYYLTGVYDGAFYYEGEKKEYHTKYSDDLKLSSDDRVEIVKVGTEYIILGVKPSGKSALWSYNTVGTEFGTKEDKAADGKLKSEVISYMLPPKSIPNVYLYKPALCYIDDRGYNYSCETKLSYIEDATGKSYYMLFLHAFHSEQQIVAGTKFPERAKDIKIIEKYAGLINSIMRLYKKDNLNPLKYCFNDFENEHPVRFVIDAAKIGIGTVANIVTELYTTEMEQYYADMDADSYKGAETYALEPYTPDEKRIYAVGYDEEGLPQNTTRSPVEYGACIIGHFEEWNDELKRYDNIPRDAELLYQLVDEEGNAVLPEDSDVTKKYYNKAKGISYTAIKLDYAGIITENIELSHIANYNGRIFASVKGGAMLLCSAMGKHTNFSEFYETGTDSGFFEESSDGEYSGLCEYQGLFLAFKRDRISLYYGTPPYSMTKSRDIQGVGCVDSRSIKEVRGVLYFLGEDGFYSYSGGMPKRISRKLNRRYISAFAYEDSGCYAVDAVSEEGERELLIYNPDFDAWVEGDSKEYVFASDGKLITKSGEVLKKCDFGEWQFETGDIFEGIFEDKGINEIYIRGRLSGKMKVTTVSDVGEDVHSEISDDTGRLKVWRIPVRLKHKNYYRIRIEGTGECILYAVERSAYIGGKKR